jgi:membrane-associated sensor protein
MHFKMDLKSPNILLGILSLIGLYLVSRYSYLLFHSLSEMFSIVIACGIFMIAWNSQKYAENSYFLFIGIAYLFIGSLDFIHTLGYKGMGIFIGYDANLPTQLWIAARYLESISLLIAPIFLNRRIDKHDVLWAYGIIAALLIASIFTYVFPDCFVEGSGLTLFKKLSEFVISGILAGAILFLFSKRSEFDEGIFNLLIGSMALTIGAELSFTFYINVYGLSNLIGHYFKIVSFYLIYRAIIKSGLEKPYSLLFRNLKQSEESLKKEHRELQDALAEIKTLSGMLPICSHCKKIRDDKGYWNQIEAYIRRHSEAEFSHSICPECQEKYYAEFFPTEKEDGASSE